MTLKPFGSLAPAPNVILAVLPVPFRQCAAVVTTRAWISVPVQPLAPSTRTVLGHAHAAAGSPPTTAWERTATGGAAPSVHAASAHSEINKETPLHFIDHPHATLAPTLRRTRAATRQGVRFDISSAIRT
jgi:hypothetical protein